MASRYLTIASAVSSEAAETSRSISSRFGLAAAIPLPETVNPSIFARARPGPVGELGPGRARGDGQGHRRREDDRDVRPTHSTPPFWVPPRPSRAILSAPADLRG